MKLPYWILLVCIFLATVFSHPPARIKKNTKSEGFGFSPSCAACVAAIWSTSMVLKIHATETVVIELSKIICKLFAKQPWAVCDGISSSFRDEFFYVFRQIGTRSPSQICGILLPDCANPADPSGAGWVVDIPPMPLKKKRTKKIKIQEQPSRPLRVLQLSDLHIDLEYQEGTEAKCDMPVCCRESSSKYANGFPAIPSLPALYWGTIASCDIPFRTLEHMLEYIRDNLEVDYIMMTGDYINHVDWKYTIKEHQEVLQKIGGLIKKNFFTTPTYWAIGNHEGVPVNSFAPHSVDERFWPTWLYSEIANISHPWINKEANDTMNYRGSYSVDITDGLKLISLNTGYCETTNFFLYINQNDPDQTMSWFVSELLKAEQSGKKVHIMAHIPPGDGECLEGWARNYYRVIQRFSSTITGQFFGHVHTDYFTVFYQDMKNISSKPIGVGYAAPSATTFSGLNPAFRIYEISTDGKFEIQNIENYSADLSLANITNPPQWKLLYKAKEDLKLPDLSPRSWENYIRRLQADNDAFDQFVQYSYRTEDTSCGLNCRKAILCSMRMGHHDPETYCPSFKSDLLKTNRVDF